SRPGCRGRGPPAGGAPPSVGSRLRVAGPGAPRAHGGRAEILMQADSAVVTIHEGDRFETMTVVSAQQITRLDRYTEIRQVLARARDPEADLDRLSDELVEIAKSPPPYPAWLAALGVVLFTAGFSVNVQATWQELWVATASGCLVALITLAAQRHERVSQLVPFIAAVSVSLFVLILYNQLDLDGGAILLIVPALFFFIPGDVLSASMFDMSEGRVTAGSTQLVYAIFSILLLYLGVVFAAALTSTSGDDLFAEALPGDFPDVVAWLGWVVFTLGFALAFSVAMRHFGWILLVTLVAFGGQQVGTMLFGEVIGASVGATAMIVVALIISRDPSRPPNMVLALCGFFVLTVGALGLEGFTALVSGDPVAGFSDLLSMFTIGMAIAIGLLIGSVIGSATAQR
ncbi:MAG: threonine/serine exporter family protein, partial [Acidimicrobiia bacterium]|nr:threonine/serine exporter family protein [Acidimicrobiia bacterium]